MSIDNASGEVLSMVGGATLHCLSSTAPPRRSVRWARRSSPMCIRRRSKAVQSRPTSLWTDRQPFRRRADLYTPHNYEGNYLGSMQLLYAFAESRNIPALKLASHVGIRKVIDTAHRFGITSDIPPFLPVALGSADISLYEQVGAYSVFPNDGIRIAPHYIRKVTQADGLPLDEKPTDVREVISVETARTMMQLLQAVVRMGTGARASQLNHPLGGKTGTTNNYTDAWFIGFSPSVTCGTWIGFDNRQSLGEKETGARAALPMWMDYMKAEIANKPNEFFPAEGAPKKTLNVVAAAKPTEPVKPSEDDEDHEAPAGPPSH